MKVRRTVLSTALVATLFLTPVACRGVGSVSTSAARPLGMGGAFMAVEDQIAGALWNPAAFSPPDCITSGGFRAHVNILGGPAVIRETGLLTGVESDQFEELDLPERTLVAVGALLKSASFRRGGFSAGVVLLEEHLDPVALVESQGLADAGDLLSAYYSTAVVSFRLDSRVSIGMALTLFTRDDGGERRFGTGRSYGALLRPNDEVTVGLTYVDVPAEFGDYRSRIEGIGPRTMNAGIAWRPREPLAITLDLRDLAEKSGETSLEPRAGLEWNLWNRGALRAGAFREDGGDRNVLSIGAGAIPMRPCWRARGAPPGDEYVLNYAVLLADGGRPRHLLSAVLHF
ncbi:MAG: hypothetical protein GF405_08300 [Candidatus Eisenbacteria bacterium]|nr:hypothetical protein [Candidatus Eisenbacteria bacterium]